MGTNSRVRTGFGKFRNVMEIENAFFKDLKSFGKGKVFRNGYGEVLDFRLEKFQKDPEMDVA